MMIYGAMFVLAMNVRPNGLIDATIAHRVRQRFRLRPEPGRGS